MGTWNTVQAWQHVWSLIMAFDHAIPTLLHYYILQYVSLKVLFEKKNTFVNMVLLVPLF